MQYSSNICKKCQKSCLITHETPYKMSGLVKNNVIIKKTTFLRQKMEQLLIARVIN